MSTINPQLTTNASFDALQASLIHFGYEVTRTPQQITAIYEDTFYTSRIVITDDGSQRMCREYAYADGKDLPPDNVLTKIVLHAESFKDPAIEVATVKAASRKKTIIMWVVIILIILVSFILKQCLWPFH